MGRRGRPRAAIVITCAKEIASSRQAWIDTMAGRATQDPPSVAFEGEMASRGGTKSVERIVMVGGAAHRGSRRWSKIHHRGGCCGVPVEVDFSGRVPLPAPPVGKAPS